MLRDHGQAKKYYHDMEGYNGRLDSIQAGILRVKLAHLAAWNERRRECARDIVSCSAAAERGYQYLPVEPSWSKAVYHLYVVQVQNRERTSAAPELTPASGREFTIPIPLHLQNAYKHLGYHEGDFPVCEEAARTHLVVAHVPGTGGRTAGSRCPAGIGVRLW